MKKDDSVYLRHIIDAFTQIEFYMNSVSHEEFLRNRLLQDGVIRQLEVMGEAARNISEELRNEYPEIPWRQMIGLRNRMIHAYFNVDLQIIWEIEPDARTNEKSGLPEPTGFDSPKRFDAFLNAVRWGAISSADIRSLQAPFRSGITIEDYQLDPLVRAVQMPRANLLIADDVGLGAPSGNLLAGHGVAFVGSDPMCDGFEFRTDAADLGEISATEHIVNFHPKIVRQRGKFISAHRQLLFPTPYFLLLTGTLPWDLARVGHVLRFENVIERFFGEPLLFQNELVHATARLESLFGNGHGFLIPEHRIEGRD